MVNENNRTRATGLWSVFGSLRHTVSLELGLKIPPFSFVCERRRLSFLPADSFTESRPALASPSNMQHSFSQTELGCLRAPLNTHPVALDGAPYSHLPPKGSPQPGLRPAARTSSAQTSSPSRPQDSPGGSCCPFALGPWRARLSGQTAEILKPKILWLPANGHKAVTLCSGRALPPLSGIRVAPQGVSQSSWRLNGFRPGMIP